MTGKAFLGIGGHTMFAQMQIGEIEGRETLTWI